VKNENLQHEKKEILAMMKIDARGLSCPQPVVMTQKAIGDGASEFEVLEVKEEGDDIIITARK
jgi:TusA-related sulfurtransferase